MLKALYYRRKILLALMDMWERPLSQNEIQYLLFLLSNNQIERSYHFVPLKAGPFSFQLREDLNALADKIYILRNSGRWSLAAPQLHYLEDIDPHDFMMMGNLKKSFYLLDEIDTQRFIILNYPLYGVHSTRIHELFSPEEVKLLRESLAQPTDTTFYTIGYEGKTIEEFIKELIIQDIKVLCDVRKNPFSIKFGFSQDELANYLKHADVAYVHLPHLGMESHFQSMGKSTERTFFTENAANSAHTKEDINNLLMLLRKNKRVAITCFDRDPDLCQRTQVAFQVQKSAPAPIPIINL